MKNKYLSILLITLILSFNLFAHNDNGMNSENNFWKNYYHFTVFKFCINFLNINAIRDFEFSLPELRVFRKQYAGKVAACVGEYHVPFIQDVFDGKEIQPPKWDTHIDTKREDKFTPQDPDFLKRIYANLKEALKE